MAILEERVTLLHGCVDAFERRVEECLGSTQTPYFTAIHTEIQQLCEDMRTATPVPLVIPIPDVMIEVPNLFADDPPPTQSVLLGRGVTLVMMILMLLGETQRGWRERRWRLRDKPPLWMRWHGKHVIKKW